MSACSPKTRVTPMLSLRLITGDASPLNTGQILAGSQAQQPARRCPKRSPAPRAIFENPRMKTAKAGGGSSAEPGDQVRRIGIDLARFGHAAKSITKMEDG